MVTWLRRHLANPDLLLVRMVILAAVIAVVYYGKDRAKDPYQLAVLTMLGLAAVGFEYRGARKMTRAWIERSAGGVLGWGAVWAFAVAWSLNGAMTVAANSQDALSAARLEGHTKHADVRGAVTRAAADVDRISKKLTALAGISINGREVTTIGDAEALIAKAKSHRFWKRTEQCGRTMGPDTRRFCDEYRAAVSAKATAIERGTTEEEFHIAQERLDAARKAAAGVAAVTSSTRADVNFWHARFGASTQDVEFGQALLATIVLSMFLSLAGLLVEAEEHRNSPRRTWINWDRWSHIIWGGRPGIRTLPHAPATLPPRAVLPAAPAPNLPAPQPVVARAEPTVVEKIRNMRSLVTFSGHAIPLRS